MIGKSLKALLPREELLNYFDTILRVYNRGLSSASARRSEVGVGLLCP